MKKDRKNQRRLPSDVVVRFFLHEHISPRTSSTVVRVRLPYEFRLEVFVRYARWRACQDSLSCWTRLALANEKEGER